MKALLSSIQMVFPKFIKYGMVGGVAASLAWISGILTYSNLDWPYAVSQLAGFLVGTATSYPLSRLWAFRNQYPKIPKQAMVFLVVSIGGLVVNELSLIFAVRILHLWVWLSMGVGLGVGFLWNFSIHNWITFGKLS
ncbi:MAG: GtrA family protein [Sulfobacillus sp.]